MDGVALAASTAELLRVDGLPVHPLVVHAPIVLLPLVAAGVALLVVRPGLRRTVGPVVALLAIGAAVTSVAAAWSGDALGGALGRGSELAQHRRWGELTRFLSILLACGATGLAVLPHVEARRRWLHDPLGPATVVVAIAAVGAVALAGHAGATLAWEGRVPDDGAATVAPVSGVPPTATPSDREVALPGSGQPGVDVVLGEWALVPSTEQAPAGMTTFRFRNLGTMPHAFRIRTPGSGGDRLEWRSEVVAPGEIGLLVADLAPGTYELDCPVEDGHGEHDALGMEMVFTVRADAPPLAPLSAEPADAAGDDAPVAGVPSGGDGAIGGDGTTDAVTVDIAGFAYQPATVHLAAGGSVTWTNSDPAPHTATGDGFDTGTLAAGEQARTTFTTPGTYAYRCTIHPAMQATVVIDP